MFVGEWSCPIKGNDLVLFLLTRDARNMAREVQSTLLSIVKQYGQKTESEAAEYIKKLQKRGRYLQDVWS